MNWMLYTVPALRLCMPENCTEVKLPRGFSALVSFLSIPQKTVDRGNFHC